MLNVASRENNSGYNEIYYLNTKPHFGNYPYLLSLCCCFCWLGGYSWGHFNSFITRCMYLQCMSRTHLNDLWTDRWPVCITISRHGTCFWDGRPCV